MGADTLLVTGIHREELAFGDRVAALLDDAQIDVMRIPHGITQKRTGTGDPFYFNTQHREIYLQLRQQVKGRYRLLIDLHCGINETGHCADIFCHDRDFLRCLAGDPAIVQREPPVRLIRILAPTDAPHRVGSDDLAAAGAHTCIPREVWDDGRWVYVGLEVYLPQGDPGNPDDWRFTRDLIGAIQSCRRPHED